MNIRARVNHGYPILRTALNSGVNNLGKYGRWAFAEFTEAYRIEADFEAGVEAEFFRMIEGIMKDEE